MKGILADANVVGHIEALVRRMQAEPWAEFWAALGIAFLRFEDVGLFPTSTDAEIWHTCQAEKLVLITDNRNRRSPDSLEATLRQHNRPDCLPVFTIADIDKFRTNRQYVEKVVERLYDYLTRIDEVRGAGRLYLP